MNTQTHSGVLEVGMSNFESEVLNSEVPVLVDLYATWCPPCRIMAQVLDKVAPQLAGRAKIVKVNTDVEQEIAGAFGVSSIPTLAMIVGRKVVDMSVGAVPASRVLQMVEAAEKYKARGR